MSGAAVLRLLTAACGTSRPRAGPLNLCVLPGRSLTVRDRWPRCRGQLDRRMLVSGSQIQPEACS